LVAWRRGRAERWPECGLWTCGVVWERGLPEYARGGEECPPPRDPPPRCCAARGRANMVKAASKQSDLYGITLPSVTGSIILVPSDNGEVRIGETRRST